MSNLLDIIKTNYSLNANNTKWTIKGSELLKYVGLEVVLISFKKIDNTWQTDKSCPVTIKSIDDWSETNFTYQIKYEKEGELISERIIPEGFILNDPDKDLWARRFIPYSLHLQIIEEEGFFKRIEELFKQRPTLPLESINKLFSESKDMINYYRNICLVIDTTGGLECGFSCIRINQISNIHFNKKENTWNIGLKDSSNNYYLLQWDSISDSINYYVSGTFVGKSKIIDLAG